MLYLTVVSDRQEDDEDEDDNKDGSGENNKKDEEAKEEDNTKAMNVLDRLDKDVESAKSHLQAIFSQDKDDGTTGEDGDEMVKNGKEKPEDQGEPMDDSDLFAEKKDPEQDKMEGEEDEFIDGEHFDGDGLVTSLIMQGGLPL